MPETLLAFDYGERRVGVAVGQVLTGTATPLRTLERASDDALLDEIAELVAAWRPDALVVGIPVTEGGEVQAITRAARRFAGQLAARFGLPVHHADERLTSRAAEDRFRDLRRGGGAKRNAARRLDAVAAQLILEQWLAERTARC